ncbi:MAG: hypothetical protein IKS98_10585 [Lachnospiraceae bacterium]|nr:hypothetical protein [Lachnospiraceae bacterium]
MKKTAYLAFTSFSYRLLCLLMTVVFMVGSFLANIYVGKIAAILLATLMPVMYVFLDFFAFSGTSSRKQRTMNFIKSSYKGTAFFRSALKTDTILKNIFLLSGFLGFIIAELVYYTDFDSFEESMLMILVYLPISQITTMLSLIASRRMSLTLLAQTSVCYLCSMTSTLLFIIYSFLLPEEMNSVATFVIIAFVVLELIAIALAVVVYKDCVKGYDSSFVDT